MGICHCVCHDNVSWAYVIVYVMAMYHGHMSPGYVIAAGGGGSTRGIGGRGASAASATGTGGGADAASATGTGGGAAAASATGPLASGKAFCAMKVVSLAQDRKTDELHAAAKAAIATVKKLPTPANGWRGEMPGWLKKGKEGDKAHKTRGLKAWVKDPSFCFSWLQQGVDFYSGTIGSPPVETGVKTKSKKRKRAKGHTRGQIVLSKAAANNTIDYKSTFLLVVVAHYCMHAKPVVEDGTDASHAVLAVMLEPETTKVVLSTVCHVHVSYNSVMKICHEDISWYMSWYMSWAYVMQFQMVCR